MPNSVEPLTQPAEKLNPDDLTGKRVFVLDSHSLIYQVFHAIGNMTGPNGQAVNALYGFTRDLLDIMEKWKPDLLFASFDHSEITFRNDIYPAYKAHRDPMPEDLRSQIPDIQRLVKTLAVPILVLPGYEADDILATLAREVEERGGECVLVTSDKDCRQLITDKVSLLNLRKGELYQAAELARDWGIRPDQVVDFQSLVGDSVDNVPGVPTIGPKTATQLLEQFGSLEQILDRWSEIKGKKGETIRDSRAQALLSQQLVRLNAVVPIEIDWQGGLLGSMDVAAAVALCEEKGFRSLTDRVARLAGPVKVNQWIADYQTVDDLEEFKRQVAEAQACGVVSFDCETTSPLPRWAQLVGVSLAWRPGHAIYVPAQAPQGEKTIDEASVIEALRPLLEDPQILIVGQNLKYDMIVMRGAGLEIRCRLFDTMVADYLVNPGHPVHNMDDLALRFLKHQTIKISELIGRGKQQILMNAVPVAAITAYAAEDADVPLRLMPLLKAKLEEGGLWDLFDSVEMPLIQVLAEMEFNGIAVNRQHLEHLSVEFNERLGVLVQTVHELAGQKFNLDSPKQVAEILFEKLKLPSSKKKKTTASTDNEVLEELVDLHPIAQAMIDYRQLSKLKSTYADALVQQIHPITGRVHTSFMQDVARTGRLSSKEPNLQNIPIRREEGRRIRQAFIAGAPDRLLISADYSQIELRVLAHFSEDPALIQAFENDDDIHSVVAAQVNNVSLGDVTSEMRRQAKAINFGIIYGQSAFGLAKELGISKQAAAEFIEAYFSRYAAVETFMASTLRAAAQDGFVRTILGRKRDIEGVRPPEKTAGNRNLTMPERIAINTVIQGSAADLIKVAMIKVLARLKSTHSSAKLLLQIHDELVVEVPEDNCAEVAAWVREEMSHAFALKVPLRVSVEVGKNWDETIDFPE